MKSTTLDKTYLGKTPEPLNIKEPYKSFYDSGGGERNVRENGVSSLLSESEGLFH